MNTLNAEGPQVACPIAPLVLVGATLSGTHTVFFQDRRRRAAAWAVLTTLVMAWSAYAFLARTPPVRLGLEALSVLAVLAGTARAWWLARHGVHSPLWPWLAAAVRHTVRVAADPFVLGVQVWLACMLTMQWRGKAHFSGMEYGSVALLLAVTAAIRITRTWRRQHARRRPFAALESYAAARAAERCPLGFGADGAKARS